MKAILTYNGNPTKPKVVARGIDESIWPYPDHETSAYYAEKLRGRYTGFLVEIETENVPTPNTHVSKIRKVTELAGIECIPFDLDKATQFAWKAFIHLECKKLSERTENPVFTANQNGEKDMKTIGILYPLSDRFDGATFFGINGSMRSFSSEEICKYAGEFINDTTILVEVIYSDSTDPHNQKIIKIKELADINSIPFNLNNAHPDDWATLAREEYRKYRIRKDPGDVMILHGKQYPNQNGDDFSKARITAEQLRKLELDYQDVPMKFLGRYQAGAVRELTVAYERYQRQQEKDAYEGYQKQIRGESVVFPEETVLSLKQKKCFKPSDLYIDNSKIPEIDLKLDPSLTRGSLRESIQAAEDQKALDTINSIQETKMNSDENAMTPGSLEAKLSLYEAQEKARMRGIFECDMDTNKMKGTRKIGPEDFSYKLNGEKIGPCEDCENIRQTIIHQQPRYAADSLQVIVNKLLIRLYSAEGLARRLKIAESDLLAMEVARVKTNGTYLPKARNHGLHRVKPSSRSKEHIENDEDYFTPGDPAYDFRTNRDPVFEKKGK